jgi:hypothetical protein
MERTPRGRYTTLWRSSAAGAGYASWSRDFEIAAYLANEELLYLAMTRHGRDLARRHVHVNGMAAAFTKETAATSLKMAKQVDALHGVR